MLNLPDGIRCCTKKTQGLCTRIQRTHFTQPHPLALSIIIYSLPKWCGEVHFYQNTFPVTSWETLIFLILITFLLTVCLSTVSFSWNRSVLAWPFNYFPLPETLNVQTVKAKKRRFLGNQLPELLPARNKTQITPFPSHNPDVKIVEAAEDSLELFVFGWSKLFWG